MLKKTSVLLIFLFLLTSCSQTNDEKAREAVEHYCDGHVNHYLPFGFKKLQPLYASYKTATWYTAFQKSKSNLQHQKDSLQKSSGNPPDVIQLQIDFVDKKIAAIDKDVTLKSLNFKGEQIGWTIEHTYTYKNDLKRVIHTNSIFKLNLNFTQVIEVVPA